MWHCTLSLPAPCSSSHCRMCLCTCDVVPSPLPALLPTAPCVYAPTPMWRCALPSPSPLALLPTVPCDVSVHPSPCDTVPFLSQPPALLPTVPCVCAPTPMWCCRVPSPSPPALLPTVPCVCAPTPMWCCTLPSSSPLFSPLPHHVSMQCAPTPRWPCPPGTYQRCWGRGGGVTWQTACLQFLRGSSCHRGGSRIRAVQPTFSP